jgi:hypothetical protein
LAESLDDTIPNQRERNQRLRVFARALLAPAFGAAIAISYALAWLFLERAFTPRVLIATFYFALAGTLSAGAGLVSARLFSKSRFTVRIAAVLICLVAGTAGFATLFFTLDIVLSHHRLSEIPIRISLVILGISGAGTAYSMLALAAPIILPLGVPLIAIFAVLIARMPALKE